MKTMQEFKFLAFVNIFFTDSGSKEKKFVLNIEQPQIRNSVGRDIAAI